MSFGKRFVNWLTLLIIKAITVILAFVLAAGIAIGTFWLTLKFYPEAAGLLFLGLIITEFGLLSWFFMMVRGLVEGFVSDVLGIK